VRLVLAALSLLAGCAQVASEPVVASDVGLAEDPAADAEPAPLAWDAAAFADVPIGPSRDAARLDAASCAERRDACTDSGNPLRRILSECVAVEWSCGYVRYAVDGAGCLTSIELDRGREKFNACVFAAIADQRFSCLPMGEAGFLFESCTAK